MKLVVQVPCLNEEQTLPAVLKDIPKKIAGIDEIIIVIIDDGSSDRTVEVAKQLGVKHFVYHTRNQGLGRSFSDGVDYALSIGADIVVNTDGDNQYPQDRIGDLVKPILDGNADIVIADRQTHKIAHFSPVKKFLQKLGSKVVNIAAGTDVPDAVSGFRAYSREALLQLNSISRFSYCTETIIQAGNKRLALASIAVDTNPPLRKSRLFKSTRQHVMKTSAIIIRAYIMYKPQLVFGTLGTALGLLGLIPIARYIYFAVVEDSARGHLQSLIIGSTVLIGSFLCFVLIIIADLIRTNRILIESELEHTKRMRFQR